MIVSVLVAPYGWLIDQSVLIPALLHAAYRARSRTFTAILASASAVILIQTFPESGVRSHWNPGPPHSGSSLYLLAAAGNNMPPAPSLTRFQRTLARKQ